MWDGKMRVGRARREQGWVLRVASVKPRRDCSGRRDGFKLKGNALSEPGLLGGRFILAEDTIDKTVFGRLSDFVCLPTSP